MDQALSPHEEMRILLQKISGTEGIVKVRQARAATHLRLPFSRVRDLWRADQRLRIRAEELDRARTLAREQVEQIGTDLHDIAVLKRRIEALEVQFRALAARQP